MGLLWLGTSWVWVWSGTSATVHTTSCPHRPSPSARTLSLSFDCVSTTKRHECPNVLDKKIIHFSSSSTFLIRTSHPKPNPCSCSPISRPSLSLSPCCLLKIYCMQIIGEAVCVRQEASCDKIYIFNEMRWDVGEGKVRGDARTHTHTHKTSNMHTNRHVNISTKWTHAHTHTHTLEEECVKYGLIRQAVWD